MRLTDPNKQFGMFVYDVSNYSVHLIPYHIQYMHSVSVFRKQKLCPGPNFLPCWLLNT